MAETTVAVITSPAPILRRGGHSQGWDEGAENLGAFFARLLLAVDYTPGFELRVAAATPLTRYAAFLIDTVTRYDASPALRASHPNLWLLLRTAEETLRGEHPDDWTSGRQPVKRRRVQSGLRVTRSGQIGTAVPETRTPSSPGTIDTVKWLGRPISTPWTISNDAGATISPRVLR